MTLRDEATTTVTSRRNKQFPVDNAGKHLFFDYESPIKRLNVNSPAPYFNHLFASLPPGDGVSSLWFTEDTSTGGAIQRDGADAVLHVDASTGEHAQLKTTEHANYAPGAPDFPGFTFGLDKAPDGDQNAWAGVTDGNNGHGVGRDGTGPYVFEDVDGTRNKVYRGDWNLGVSDAFDGFLSGNVVRIDPRLEYGHGKAEVAIIVKDTSSSPPVIEMERVHRFIDDEGTVGPMTEQPNVPIMWRVETNTTGTQALNVHTTAVHHHRQSKEADVRENGVRRSATTVDTAWEPLISWKKRTGWEQVNSRPVAFEIQTTDDLTVEVQLDTDVSGASFGLPPHTTSSEVAVTFDKSATGFNATGERRWVSQVTGGQGNQSGAGTGELGFNLPANQTVTLAAKSDAAGATVKSAVIVGSEF